MGIETHLKTISRTIIQTFPQVHIHGAVALAGRYADYGNVL